MRADVDDGRVTRVVNQHLPAPLSLSSSIPLEDFFLRIRQFDVQVIEHARRLDGILS